MFTMKQIFGIKNHTTDDYREIFIPAKACIPTSIMNAMNDMGFSSIAYYTV